MYVEIQNSQTTSRTFNISDSSVAKVEGRTDAAQPSKRLEPPALAQVRGGPRERRAARGDARHAAAWRGGAREGLRLWSF